MKRREFVKNSIVLTSSACLPNFLVGGDISEGSLVVKVQGESPYSITKKAVSMLGGMEKFISKKDVVMVKPNISWNRTVEQGATTNPEVVKAIVEMALNAGAKKVIVMDNPLHKSEDTYKRSGVEAVAKAAGAEVRYPDENRLIIHDFKGEWVKRWPVFKDFLDVDKLFGFFCF